MTSKNTKNTKTKPSRWLRYGEAADYLGCSTRQLQRWVQQRRVSVVRMGSEALFAPEQLDEFVEACTFRPGSSA